jgi:hypothetical protein
MPWKEVCPMDQRRQFVTAAPALPWELERALCSTSHSPVPRPRGAQTAARHSARAGDHEDAAP